MQVKKIGLVYLFQISVTYVSGDRMQAQGTHGMSRGIFKEEVTTGLHMLSFGPWHMSTLEVSLTLKDSLTRFYHGIE